LLTPARVGRLTHVEELPARAGRTVDWPGWADADVVARLRAAGVGAPWAHQVAAAELAWSGRHVVLSTGTASGKSLAYLLPGLTAVRAGLSAPRGRGATVLYLAPTKALAADQRRVLADLAVPDVRVAAVDGDTPVEERDWARAHASWVLTNPDMLHRSLLPAHGRWSGLWRALRYVVVDECHHYRGVFGSHVAQVLRRLRRVARGHGCDPVFVLASATVSAPAQAARRLTGCDVVEVTDDASPRGRTTFALWEPPMLPGQREPAAGEGDRAVEGDGPVPAGSAGARARRSAVAEAADLLADLVVDGARTVAFVRSRRAAETVSLLARAALAPVDASLPGRVAAYRGGYLAEERRALESALHRGDLLGVAATTALELGIDVAGLDAVLVAGWPGTRASLWQQAGRAGRAGQQALAVLVARDDPLDTYVVHHPEVLFDRPVEETVLDPDNPYVLTPHLAAAAQERALGEDDLELFGPRSADVIEQLTAGGWLRRRPGGWYWTRRERACDLADIRGTGGPAVRLVELATGRLLGTVDAATAHATVHEGAVYLHQGVTHLVRELDVDEAVAFVERGDPGYTTTAREVHEVAMVSTDHCQQWGEATLSLGWVDVASQVVGYLRRRPGSGEVLGDWALDLPARQLRTRACWWTLSDAQVAAAGVEPADLPGAAHAAEHASIGLLPLFATCDRWDVGGVSTARHPATGRVTVVVHDAHPGGAGFAERGFAAARPWLGATRTAVAHCPCVDGCPACVQSPKCGNGNDPLDKRAAVRLLDALLGDRPAAAT
jgi:DEAD/DEAH box helicase domain-containing protein